MIAEITCLAHFFRDQDNLVTTDGSRTGLGITLSQTQNDNTIQPMAFASRYLYGKVVYLYTNQQALEP